jgi:hypothetical protein
MPLERRRSAKASAASPVVIIGQPSWIDSPIHCGSSPPVIIDTDAEPAWSRSTNNRFTTAAPEPLSANNSLPRRTPLRPAYIHTSKTTVSAQKGEACSGDGY